MPPRAHEPTEAAPLEAIQRLLCTLFDRAIQLRNCLRSRPVLDGLADHLPDATNASVADYSYALVDEVCRRGLIVDTLRALEAELPGRSTDIRRVAAACDVDLGPAPVPTVARARLSLRGRRALVFGGAALPLLGAMVALMPRAQPTLHVVERHGLNVLFEVRASSWTYWVLRPTAKAHGPESAAPTSGRGHREVRVTYPHPHPNEPYVPTLLVDGWIWDETVLAKPTSSLVIDAPLDDGRFDLELVGTRHVARARGPSPLVVPFYVHAAPHDSWTLDFGDGTPPRSGEGTPAETLLHTYAIPGRFTAVLRSSPGPDGRGAEVVKTVDVFPTGIEDQRASDELSYRFDMDEAAQQAGSNLFVAASDLDGEFLRCDGAHTSIEDGLLKGDSRALTNQSSAWRTKHEHRFAGCRSCGTHTSFWPDHFTVNGPYTIEVRIRLIDGETCIPFVRDRKDLTFYLRLTNDGLKVNTEWLRGSTLDTNDGEFHRYRVVRTTDRVHWVWRDDVLLTQQGLRRSPSREGKDYHKGLIIGDCLGGTDQPAFGTFEIDWIRIDDRPLAPLGRDEA